ncbi:MAG: hypothetical protein MJA27_10965 [Pseudanabaenales cyanobacterium]|nr:hypothetical protein [Pseudanabaenales cyanobacterium]
MTDEELKALVAANAVGIAGLRQTQAVNADQIARNAEAINRLESKMEEGFTRLEGKMSELVDIQKATEQRLESFIFESNRLIRDNRTILTKVEALCERYDGVLAYLMRKEQRED